MFKKIILNIFLGAIALSFAQSELPNFEKNLEDFSTDLFKNIEDEKLEDNSVWSPLSAYVVLSMAAYGAGGNTAEELKNALHLPSDDLRTAMKFENLMQELNEQTANFTLELANNIYIGSGLKLKSDYQEFVRKSFRSDAREVDFSKTEEALEIINDWGKEKTHNKIPELLEDVDPDTRMMLLNAVYFKGKWAVPFELEKTVDKKFHLTEDNSINVPTMFSINSYINGKLPELAAQFIELPYQNENLKMIIILPDEITGLNKIIENIEKFDEKTLAEAGLKEKLILTMPKFKIESTIKLNDHLKKLGLIDMFTNDADFRNITDENVKVNEVVQKAFIEVNEEGSEAAALTKGEIVTFSMPKHFSINRPFYFKIMKDRLNLFSGTVKRP